MSSTSFPFLSNRRKLMPRQTRLSVIRHSVILKATTSWTPPPSHHSLAPRLAGALLGNPLPRLAGAPLGNPPPRLAGAQLSNQPPPLAGALHSHPISGLAGVATPTAYAAELLRVEALTQVRAYPFYHRQRGNSCLPSHPTLFVSTGNIWVTILTGKS
jgi:hypothetical protein